MAPLENMSAVVAHYHHPSSTGGGFRRSLQIGQDSIDCRPVVAAGEIKKRSTSTTSTTITTIKPRRSVTFRNSVAYREIPHINDFEEEDMMAVWYSPDDYRLFRSACKLTVKMIMKHGIQITEQDPEFCCRGLESKTQDGAKRRQSIKLKVRIAVLREQDVQFEQEIYHPQMIAEIACKHSSLSRQEAHHRALQDAAHALVLY